VRPVSRLIACRSLHVASFVAAALFAAGPAYAQGDADLGQECDGSTAEMVECLSRQTKVWDGRLNQAYQKLMQSVQGGQREKLRAAQRLWVQYRDANCAYYAAGDGTVSRVEAAECMRSMTESRSQELEQAGGQN
jgi:uncharacterized protein YecT (DUF1311 family)